MFEQQHEDSSFVAHEPCPKCGSKDNLARYSDGHAWCHGLDCGYREPKTGSEVREVAPDPEVVSDNADLAPYYRAVVKELRSRNIPARTCQKFGYRSGTYRGQKVQFAPYRRDGKVVACKVRTADKQFSVLGDGKAMPLYGQDLWSKGRMITITEGEIDCMSISAAQDDKYAVVSVPNGAASAAKAVANALDYLEGFERINIWFDADEVGQKAAVQVAEMLPPGKAFIVTNPEGCKDANDLRKQGRNKEIINCMWEARPYRPDGIVAGADTWDLLTAEDENIEVASYPWQTLNTMTHGLRTGELVVLTAGSGIGKSAVCREITDYLLKTTNYSIGLLHLEENVARTVKGLLSVRMEIPLHLDLRKWSQLTPAEQAARRQAHDEVLGSGRVQIYDHFGSTGIENLLSKIRYMAKACGCKFVVLDHISIVVSGSAEGDERRTIDAAMTALRTLVQELQIGLIVVSHLRRPASDKGHEQGAEVSLSQLRGSHSIAQLADMVVGLERNQQSPEDKHQTGIRLLKNRFSGETGPAGTLVFDPDSGRLHEVLDLNQHPFGHEDDDIVEGEIVMPELALAGEDF